MGIFDFLFGKKAPSSATKLESPSVFRWQDSEPHCELLARFLGACNPDDGATPYWIDVLGEPPGIAVERFIKLGLLIPSPVHSKLDTAFKVVDLKPLLKERGLPVSGKKAQLIDRLMTADPEGMASIVADMKMVECSAEAREISDRYLAAKKVEKAEAVAKSLALLRARNFREASLLVSSYEAKQVFPRGLGIDWSRHDPARDIQLLAVIFEARPKILRGLLEQDWEALRIAAAMMHLWGTGRAKEWLSDDFVGVERFDHDTTVRMLKFHAGYRCDLTRFLELGIKRASVKGCGDASCEACRKIANQVMPLADLPELPHASCIHDVGCRCYLAPEIDWTNVGDDS